MPFTIIHTEAVSLTTLSGAEGIFFPDAEVPDGVLHPDLVERIDEGEDERLASMVKRKGDKPPKDAAKKRPKGSTAASESDADNPFAG